MEHELNGAPANIMRALLFLLLVTACGSSERSSNDPSTTPSTPAPTTTAPAGTCPAASVEPTVIASNRIALGRIAVDGDRLIWTEQYPQTNTGALLTCPVTGCVHAPEVIADRMEAPDNILVDPSGIIWTDLSNGGGVRACPRTGVCPSPKTLVASTRVWGITVADGALYFTKYVDPSTQSYLDGAVASCSATMGCGSTQPLLVTAQNRPQSVVVDGDAMFWNSAGTPPSFADGALLTCPKTGCTSPVVIADHLPYPTALTTDADNVYWTTLGADAPGTGGVYRCAKTGCGPEGPIAIAAKRSAPSAIAIVGDHVYWAELGDNPSFLGGVYTASLASSNGDACLAAPRVIAENQKLLGGLAVDAARVYWTTSDGNVLSAPR